MVFLHKKKKYTLMLGKVVKKSNLCLPLLGPKAKCVFLLSATNMHSLHNGNEKTAFSDKPGTQFGQSSKTICTPHAARSLLCRFLPFSSFMPSTVWAPLLGFLTLV